MPWIALIVVFVAMFSAISYETEQKSKVKIACYEAAKVNTNIKCSSND